MFLKMEYGVYFFFASLMLLSIPFVFFLLPETKSLNLESMDRLFEVKPVWRANEIVMKELQEQEEAFRREVDGADLSVEKPKNSQSDSV